MDGERDGELHAKVREIEKRDTLTTRQRPWSVGVESMLLGLVEFIRIPIVVGTCHSAEREKEGQAGSARLM